MSSPDDTEGYGGDNKGRCSDEPSEHRHSVLARVVGLCWTPWWKPRRRGSTILN